MSMICQSCGAEIAGDADACWNCDATGEAMRGVKAPARSGPVLMVALAIALVGAGAAAAWWWSSQTQRAPQIVQAPTPAPDAGAADVAAAGEAILMADPVDGPFYREFKELLPADYATIVGALLRQVPDPSKEPERFDQMLSEKLEAFQADNARAIAEAETGILARLADTLHLALRTPQVCQAAMATTYTPLPQSLVDARRTASASNLATIRAVASGRVAGVSRAAPTDQQIDTFSTDLRSLLTTAQWSAYQSGGITGLSLDEQCKVMSSFWGVIADYPDELSARWTAYQMLRNAPAASQ